MSQNQDDEEIKPLLRELKSLADAGDPEAQAVMAECCFRGNGFEKDLTAGMHYFELAEARGFEFEETLYTFVAQNYFALKNYERAAQLFKKAVDSGDTDAFLGLGKCLFDGLGVERDLKKAFESFKNACDFGLKTDELFYLLGLCYYEGAGVEKNTGSAIQFFERAAANSYLPADYQLAFIFYNGAGVKPNPERALRYFEKIRCIGCEDFENLIFAMSVCCRALAEKNPAFAARAAEFEKQLEKFVPAEPVPAEPVPAEPVVDPVPAKPVPAAKKRGRPKKAVPAAGEVPAKKRGRPKKSVPAEAEN